jgi:hypothetical protein
MSTIKKSSSVMVDGNKGRVVIDGPNGRIEVGNGRVEIDRGDRRDNGRGHGRTDRRDDRGHGRPDRRDDRGHGRTDRRDDREPRIGDRIEHKLDTVRGEVSERDIDRAVDMLNGFGQNLELDEVLEMMESRTITTVFSIADEDSQNFDNYDVLKKLLTGKLGVEVDSDAAAAVEEYLQYLTDDSASFDYELGRNGATEEEYWTAMAALNVNIPTVMNGDELQKLKSVEEVFVGNAANIATLEQFAASIRFSTPEVKAKFAAWVETL